jgi:serine/threonine protein kinase
MNDPSSSLPVGSDELVDLGRRALHEVCPSYRPQKGHRIDGNHYVLVEPIGSGGFGEVWKALDTRDQNSPVAIKFLHPDRVGDRIDEERFEQEANLVREFRHPSIPAIRGIGRHHTPEGADIPFIVMELVSGKTLRKTEIPTLRGKIEVIRSILSALDHAHDRGVIHRDLKPENVIVEGEGEGLKVHIMDFGLAKIRRTEESRNLTLSGAIVGTPRYMSPEQARDSRKVDARTDLYSVGVMLYEGATGKLPVSGDTHIEFLENLLHREPISPRRLNPDLSPGLEAIIVKCLEKDRNHRYGNAKELLQDLELHLEGKSPKHAHLLTSLFALRRRIRKQPLPWVVSSAAILVLLAVMADRARSQPGLAESKGAPSGVSEQPRTPEIRAFELAPGIRLELAWIRPGEFIMGDRKGRKMESTEHKVTLTQGFWMGVTEVTQGQWKAILGSNPSRFRWGDELPVEDISWIDCQTFLGLLNEKFRAERGELIFDLPSEAEWEYACRAGTRTGYSFGDKKEDLEEFAWVRGNADGKTHPVAQRRPNPWGLYDMHGNVWEWCRDWYDPSYVGGPTDPTGPDMGQLHSIRGGSWVGHGPDSRSAYRSGVFPTYHDYNGGCRIILHERPVTTTKFTVKDAAPTSGGSIGGAFPIVDPAGHTAFDIASDGTHLYIFGSELVAAGETQWRIEKRLSSTGALVAGFGTGGVVNSNSGPGDNSGSMHILIDSTYMYLLSAREMGNGAATYNYYMEKRTLSTGALVPAFNSTGTLTGSSLGANGPVGFAIDSTSIYLVMGIVTGASSGDGQIEKRDKTTGAYITAFGTSGIVTETPTANLNAFLEVVSDGTNLYVVGAQNGNPGTHNLSLWIEKRLASDGSLVAAFGTGGVVVEAPPFASLSIGLGIAQDGTSLYILDGQRPNTEPNATFRVEKRSMADGSLTTSVSSAGVFISDVPAAGGLPNRMVLSGTSLYFFGQSNTGRVGEDQWYIEKRKTADLSFDTTFGTAGVVLSNPTAGKDGAFLGTVSGGILYAVGFQDSGAGNEWRIEARWK